MEKQTLIKTEKRERENPLNQFFKTMQLNCKLQDQWNYGQLVDYLINMH